MGFFHLSYKKKIFLGQYLSGDLEDTIMMLGLVIPLLPNILLSLTTELVSIDKVVREKGIKSGRNVVIPNLSTTNFREKYHLYDWEICMGD